MTAKRQSGGLLAGIRIVEFAGIGPGPYAAMLLADMGAEIIRIDRPGGSDPYSRFAVSRGRPVVEADLKHPADRDHVLLLRDEADALIEGFRPGVMERLGLGPDDVLARNPRLVYGRMTGWGQDGPLARTARHDTGYIAVTGALDAIGPAEAPVPPLNLVGDYGGGSLFLVSGILAALLSARRTGEGQVMDAAICDGVASLMAMFYDMRAQGAWVDRRDANLLDGGAPFYRTFARSPDQCRWSANCWQTRSGLRAATAGLYRTKGVEHGAFGLDLGCLDRAGRGRYPAHRRSEQRHGAQRRQPVRRHRGHVRRGIPGRLRL